MRNSSIFQTSTRLHTQIDRFTRLIYHTELRSLFIGHSGSCYTTWLSFIVHVPPAFRVLVISISTPTQIVYVHPGSLKPFLSAPVSCAFDWVLGVSKKADERRASRSTRTGFEGMVWYGQRLQLPCSFYGAQIPAVVRQSLNRPDVCKLNRLVGLCGACRSHGPAVIMPAVYLSLEVMVLQSLSRPRTFERSRIPCLCETFRSQLLVNRVSILHVLITTKKRKICVFSFFLRA